MDYPPDRPRHGQTAAIPLIADRQDPTARHAGYGMGPPLCMSIAELGSTVLQVLKQPPRSFRRPESDSI